jgi:hypothetical protein
VVAESVPMVTLGISRCEGGEVLGLIIRGKRILVIIFRLLVGEEINPRHAEEVIQPNSSNAQVGNPNLNLDKGSEVVKDIGNLIAEGFGEEDWGGQSF